MIPALIAGGVALWRGATIASTVAPLVRPAVRIASKLLKRTAHPGRGVGSKVTKGPLKLGKQTLMGPARPGIGTILRAGVAVAAGGAAGIGALRFPVKPRPGVGTVASHRTAGQPTPQARRSAPARSERRCCPKGTLRMVCYKRKKDPEAERKRKAKRKAKAERRHSRAEKKKATAKRKAAAKRARRTARRVRRSVRRRR